MLNTLLGIIIDRHFSTRTGDYFRPHERAKKRSHLANDTYICIQE